MQFIAQYWWLWALGVLLTAGVATRIILVEMPAGAPKRLVFDGETDAFLEHLGSLMLSLALLGTACAVASALFLIASTVHLMDYAASPQECHSASHNRGGFLWVSRRQYT